MTYKPGDRVLVELTYKEAEALNNKGDFFQPTKIIEHYPAPEKTVWFVNVYNSEIGCTCKTEEEAKIVKAENSSGAIWRIEHTNGKNPVISEVGDE